MSELDTRSDISITEERGARRWVFRALSTDPKTTFPDFPELMGQLLLSRGIEDPAAALEYLEPDYERGTHDPFLFFGMGRVIERLLRAIEHKEQVFILGDYDADGVCGAVVFSDTFGAIGFEHFEVYIPDRHKEGFGLSDEVVSRAISSGARVLITIDCGVTNVAEVARAQKAGIDVIIIDHHLVPPVWPDAYAIIDPKQPEDHYPSGQLCGAALAFKVVCALLLRGSFGLPKGWERWLLDVVAIATVADMVPLTEENRILVHWGLAVLRKTRRPGLRELLRSQGLRRDRIVTEDIGFTIAPRINVASRLAHAQVSFRLLTTVSSEEAVDIVRFLEEKTRERRTLVAEILEHVRGLVGAGSPSQGFIVVGDRNWQPGVLGIAANRLLEEYSCPVFLWGKGEARHVKGSCRSRNVNVVELMRTLPDDFFIDFGGHAHSGGFSFQETRLPVFEEQLARAFLQRGATETDQPLILDGELTLEDVSRPTLEAIERLGPFGVGNERPVFLFRGVTIAQVRFLGGEQSHVMLTARRNDGALVAIMGFWMGKVLPRHVQPGSCVTLAATLERSQFQGREELRLRLIDVGESVYL